MVCCDLIGETIDAVDQNPREQEVRCDDDAFVTKLGCMAEARFNKRECDARIPCFDPAKAKTFVQHTRDFCDIAVGVWIRRTAPDDDKAGVVERDFTIFDIGSSYGIGNAPCGGRNHFGINTEFAAIADLHAVFGSVGVQHGRDVVLGMHRGEQHAGHGENTFAASFAQLIEAVADHGVRKFEVAVFGLPVVGQIRGQLVGQRREFVHRGLGARPVSADHDACFW